MANGERKPSRQRGITLLELVVALVIIALAVPALLGLYTTALQDIGCEQETVPVTQILPVMRKYLAH